MEESKEMDRKLQEVADQIEAQGYTIVWETPKQGVFLPYIVNAEGESDGAFLLILSSDAIH